MMVDGVVWLVWVVLVGGGEWVVVVIGWCCWQCGVVGVGGWSEWVRGGGLVGWYEGLLAEGFWWWLRCGKCWG